jgi:hypothetical protein
MDGNKKSELVNEIANWLQKALDRKLRMNIIRSRPKKRGEKQESCLTKKLQNNCEIGLTKTLTKRTA